MSAAPHLPADPTFSFAFQPVVDAVAREVAGFEALIRGTWDEPAWQVLQQVPREHLSQFDQTARGEAIALAARLGIKGNLHLNFLPNALQDSPKTIFTTIDRAHQVGLPIHRIVLEVPERDVSENPSEFADLMREVRGLGIQLAIDDYGGGGSGLNMLADLEPDQVKLDMGLLRGIERHGPRQSIVRAIVSLCAELDIAVVAEGVETVPQFAWLIANQVRLFQGYLFARPAFEAFPTASFPPLPADVALPPALPVKPVRPEAVARRSRKSRA
ncbi:MAG TPA: EAL domain-containing protein [Acidobacteriaceae bacterium]|jgi:EAL domain-containing protein (putative c-di-GMP-specific phosphodiesterase class I)|nr:EAL domain-containing protein [Acidobacteriaceae bacterium]